MKYYKALAANQRILDTKHPSNSMIRETAEGIREALEARLPRGSGFDAGTKILEVSDKRIVFETEFHHMNENGYYTKWTKHLVRLVPSFELDFTIKVTGPNDNDIRSYIEEVFVSLMYEEFKP